MLYPIKLKAPLKDYIWGGTRLKSEYNKETSLDKVAESWELSCHKDGHSIIVNGDAEGMTLAQYIAMNDVHVLGSHGDRYSYFPLLIKLIDAAENLSIQVHPDDEYAFREAGEYGKTELWYVLDCEPGAKLIYGFNRDISQEEFRQRIENKTLLEVCNQIPVKKGDTFFIGSGTLHSIGGGIMLAEIQQNSNTSYRVYDYERLDRDGKPRQLHIDRAVEVTKFARTLATGNVPNLNFFGDFDLKILSECEFFKVYHFDLHGRCHLNAGKESFHSILVLDGLMEMETSGENYILEKGDSYFVPAYFGEYWLRGKGSFILSMV